MPHKNPGKYEDHVVNNNKDTFDVACLYHCYSGKPHGEITLSIATKIL
jgi:hypothetical protein